MNLYRDNYRQAQEWAERILLMKKGRFLDEICADSMGMEARFYVPDIYQWYQLHGFRRNEDELHTLEGLQRTVNSWVRATTESGYSTAFAMVRKENGVSVLYGTGKSDIGALFRANISECNIHQVQWEDTEYRYNGILTGTIRAKNFAEVFASSGIKKGYVSCIISPLADEEIQDKLRENRRWISALSEYKSFQRVYGNATRRVEEIPLFSVVQAIALLQEETEYIEGNMGGGFVRTAVRFGADTWEEYRTLGALIQSCMDYDRETQKGFEPIRSFQIPGKCRTWRECLAIPCVNVVSGSFAEEICVMSLQDVKSVASFCVPPINSYEGFFVKNYNIDENSREEFPIVKFSEKPGVGLGKVFDCSYETVIPFEALHDHTFVAGATDTGKTTTVKKILTGVHTAGIPFVVIEAAKKEYIQLLGSIPELKIYTPGTDGVRLQINPLQPEDGVLIENQVDAVVRALMAATGGEHPIPEAFDGLLKQTYEKFGWEYGMMAYTDEHRPFPTFQDVYENLDSYIAAHAKYGPEVKQNLTGALTLRTEKMYTGALGQVFSMRQGLKAADLLNSPCVIELADFSEASTAFIMNILLFKFHSFLSRKPESRDLKRLIVVEEAHNVFKETLSEDSPRAINNASFEKMLAEIRASGTGLILSDQCPGIMTAAAMANTAVKVVHGLVDPNDQNAIGIPCNLSKSQRERLREFKAGECVVSLRGEYGVQHTMVEPATTEREYNPACHICTSRFRCRREAVRKLMGTMEPSKLAFHISKIQANPYNFPQLERNISNMLEDFNVTAADTTKVCLLGEILKNHAISSTQESRVITNAFAEFLKSIPIEHEI